MSLNRFKKPVVQMLCAALIIATGCKQSSLIRQSSPLEKELLGTYSRGWITYKIYRLPLASTARGTSKRNTELVLSIKIINTEENGASPLRRQSKNLDQYNVLYEYLLNQAKNDLTLVSGNAIAYPVYYAFENNYNVVPFETINVGYDISSLQRRRRKNNAELRLFYMDKIFAHDTLSCSLTHPQSI